MTLLHQAPNRRIEIEPPETRLYGIGDQIDSNPFEGLVDYYLGWSDRHWSEVRPNHSLDGTGMLGLKQGIIKLQISASACDRANPGRSARSR